MSRGFLVRLIMSAATLIDRRAIRAVPVDEAQRDQLIDRFRDRASTSFLRAYWEAGASRKSRLGTLHNQEQIE